ncbi:MAG: FAD-binding protein [Acidimicrobiales bacterium]
MPVRRGWLPVGAEEVVAEAHGVALVVGAGASDAARQLAQSGDANRGENGASELTVLELGEEFGPGEWARAIAPHLEHVPVVVLPASPDGRDLAPRLAAQLERPLLAGAVAVDASGALLVRHQGRQVAKFACSGPFVATLLPGSRPALSREGRAGIVAAGIVAAGSGAAGDGAGAAEHDSKQAGSVGAGPAGTGAAGPGAARPGPAGAGPAGTASAGVRSTEVEPGEPVESQPVESQPVEAELVEVLEADPATIDLSEADLIVAAGSGIGGPETVALLARVAHSLGASLGATRVVTDAGWMSAERQIGTTGVTVSPRCYVALGISGAAQHLAGLGTPRHIISANIDRSCPMMAMADLALVTDVPALVEALARRLADTAAPDRAAPASPADQAAAASPADQAAPASPRDQAAAAAERGAGDGGQP